MIVLKSFSFKIRFSDFLLNISKYLKTVIARVMTNCNTY